MTSVIENKTIDGFPSVLPYDLDYLTDELKQRAKTELNEDEKKVENTLQELKLMLKDEENLYWPDKDEFLIAFLRTRKYDVQQAFKNVTNFYRKIDKHPELFYNFDYEDVKRTLKENIIGILPYRDKDGCVIVIINSSNWQPDVSSLGEVVRALACGLLQAISSPPTQVAGFKTIVDLRGFSMRKLAHTTPKYLILMAQAMQSVFPGRFKAVHVIDSKLFNYIWTVFKPFLSEKLKNRFHFHGMDPKELHEYFDPRILPKDYDGELPTYDCSEWAVLVEKHKDELANIFYHGYETHRKLKK